MHTDQASVQPGQADDSSRQTTVVREHFRDASVRWGSRYDGQAKRMSDLDLLLRRETVHRFLRRIMDEAGRPVRVLDVGCGSGDVLNGIPRDSVRVFGVDLVPEMVAEAARNHPADRFAAASADPLPFAAGCADIVTCLGVVEYVPDPHSVLCSLRDALTPDGRLIVSFPNAASLCRKFSDVEIGIERRLFAVAATLRGRRHDASAAVPRYKHRQWTVRRAERLLKSVGFEITEVRLNTFGPWGALGRLTPSLALSSLLSRRCGERSVFSSLFGCTMVFDARRK